MRLFFKFSALCLLLFQVISNGLPLYAKNQEFGCNLNERELYHSEIVGYSDFIFHAEEEIEERCLEVRQNALSIFNLSRTAAEYFCSFSSDTTFGILRAKGEPTFSKHTSDTCYRESGVKEEKLIYSIAQSWSCCIPLPVPKIDKKKDDCCRCPSFSEINEMTKDRYDDFVFFRGLQGDRYNPDKGDVCRSELEWALLLGGLTDTGGYIKHSEGLPEEKCSQNLQEYCLYRSGPDSMGGTTFVAIACRSNYF